MTVKKKVVKDEPTSYDVLNVGGEYIRTYSKKMHGKDFKKIAWQFAASHKHLIK